MPLSPLEFCLENWTEEPLSTGCKSVEHPLSALALTFPISQVKVTLRAWRHLVHLGAMHGSGVALQARGNLRAKKPGAREAADAPEVLVERGWGRPPNSICYNPNSCTSTPVLLCQGPVVMFLLGHKRKAKRCLAEDVGCGVIIVSAPAGPKTFDPSSPSFHSLSGAPLRPDFCRLGGLVWWRFHLYGLH